MGRDRMMKKKWRGLGKRNGGRKHIGTQIQKRLDKTSKGGVRKSRGIWCIQNRRYERRRKECSKTGDGRSWDGREILGEGEQDEKERFNRGGLY